MIDRMIVTVLLGLLGLAYGLQCPKQKTSPGREVVCYTSVPDVAQLSNAVCRCTTLVQQGYDVRNLSTSGFENFRKSLKEINPTLQFAISVDDPGQTLRTSGTVRQEATARLMGILKEVDGVELNMTAGSSERLLHFLKGLKDEMVKKSYDKRIFLVLPTKPEELAKQFELKQLSKYVDLFTIPTHYLVEDDEAYHTFHPSRLMGLFDMYNADSLIDLVSGLGAPKRKILVSVPASAYRFTLKDQDDNAPKALTEEMQPVIIDQKQLCDSMSKDEWTIERDEDLTAPYAFKNKTWIAFEDKISISIKGKYALLRDLPGLAIRNIENDFETKCGKPLTHEIHHSFTDFKRKSRAAVLNALEDDLHQTQLSYPTKVRSSEFRVVRVVDTEGHIRAVRENTQTEFTCSRQGYFVHPKSCNRFYRCVKFNQEVEDYSVFEFDCPAGLAFDEQTEVCVWPGSLSQGSPCPGSSEIAPVARKRFECPSTPGYYADPQNPRWFFACMDLGGPEMMAYEFRCPFGLIFDEQKLVCEWPWLVAGYSDSGYTRTEYSGGYGSQSTQGTGGYVTGGLPHGYSGATDAQGGVYTGTTVGLGHSGVGSNVAPGGYSGFSGAAGVGYSGSNIGSHGTSFGRGSTGYSGTTGSGYSGSAAGGHVGGGSGYSGPATGGHIGGGSGYSGSTGSGYSGSTGSGYSGSTGSGYSGSTGSGYSGSGAGGHVGGGSGYSRPATGGHIGGGSGYSGSTGSGYSGSAAGGHVGGGSGYSRPATGGHIGGGSGYSGTTGSGYSGSTAGGHVGGGSGYSGSVAGGHVGGGSGSLDTGLGLGSYGGSGTTGTKTGTGSVGGSYGGSIGPGYTGYSGSTNGVHAGSGGTKYSGASGTGSGYSGTGSTVHFGTSGGYSGTADTGYKGSAHLGGSGLPSTSYNEVPGSTFFGHGAGSGYTGSTSGVYVGSTGTGYTGSVSGGYAGSTSGAHSGSIGMGNSGSVPGGYAGSSVGGHVGPTGTSYTGTAPGGYAGSSIGGHAGSTGTGYTGAVPGGYAGPTGTSYTGSVIGGQTGSTVGIYGGSTKTGYTESAGSASGNNIGVTGSGYSGPSIAPGYSTGNSASGTKGGYQGSGVQYSGSSYGSTVPRTDYSGTTVSGSSGHGYSVQTGGHTGYSLGLGGEGVQTGTQPTQIPIYASNGLTGTGIGSVGVHGQTPGPIYVPKPDGPNVDCGYTNCQGNTQQGGGTTITGGYANQQGISFGSAFPGQGGTTTTYFGKPGTKDYGQVAVTPGTTVYESGDGYVSGSKGIGQTGDLNITLIGSDIPSIGSQTYHGIGTPTIGYGSTGYSDSGTIVTGNSVHGTIVTGKSSPGTVLTYGSTPGTLISGSSDQGTIVTGGSYPGYTKTGPSTPGYTVSGGVKTVYGGSGSPGTVVYGPSSDGVVLTGPSQPGTVIQGTSSPGIVLTGQTAAGVSFGGSIDQGTVIGPTGHHPLPESGYRTQQGSAQGGSTYESKVGRLPETYGIGYKTTEYYDNGGRGTIKFNNGDVTTKYTENDIPDYRPAGGTILPDTLVTGSHGLSTPSGFTKTGPTKTGITTATLGGRGSYVISTGKTYPTPNPNNIGEKAFEGSVAGYTKSSTESTAKVYTGATSAPCDDTSHVDTSRITLSPSQSTGYAYPQPNVPFKTSGIASTSIPISSTEGDIFKATTPTPFLNVEIYNTPKIVGSTPSPPVVHKYGGPVEGQYQDKVSIGFTGAPAPTVSSVLYTTGPLENYKTTVFEAARIPGVISTVHPVIDTGYKTVVSPTPIPVTISHDTFGGNIQTGSAFPQSQFDFGTKTSQQGGYEQKKFISSTTPSSIFGVSSTYSPLQPRPFSVSTSVPTVTEQPHINYVSTPSSGFGYFDSNSKDSFGQKLTPSTISDSLKPQTQYLPGDSISPAIGVTYRKPFPLPDITYQQSTPITPVTVTGGSPTNVEISRDQVGKLVTNYNRGTTKYVPSEYDVYTPGSIAGGDFPRKQLSSLSPYAQTYGPTTPTSFERTQPQFPGGYSKPSSVTYQTTSKSTAVGKPKVIVKWSDLHPLLLGKLGAECTCRGDPFANLRGPGSKLINSSKGKVDLANYDESEIYVDLEKEGSYEDNDYVTNQEPSAPGPLKTWNYETPAPIVVNPAVSRIQEKPSSTYLLSVTPSTGLRSSVSGFSQNNLAGTPNLGFSTNYRSGKSLSNVEASLNSDESQGASFDRYGPGGLRDSEETLEGATNCARPGLFRHPNFCNKFYACHWDQWKKRFTLHVFNCPVHLTFDNGAGACNWPSMGPACQDDNLLV